jgi:hypothetical protein
VLRIWQDDPYTGTPLSLYDERTNSLILKFDATGGVEERQLWLRHDSLTDPGESSYGVLVSAFDYSIPDDSSWFEFAPDSGGTAGTYDTSFDAGDILVGNIVPFWVRITLPATDDVGVHEDIVLKVDTDEVLVQRSVDLRFGQFINCEYDTDLEAVVFDVEAETGRWQSEWIDPAIYTDMGDVNVNTTGSTVLVSYRTSSDGTEENATSWSAVFPVIPSGHLFQIAVDFLPDLDVITEGEGKLWAHVYRNSDFSVFSFRQLVDDGEYSEQRYNLSRSTLEDIAYPPPFSIRWTGQFHVDKTRWYNVDPGVQFVSSWRPDGSYVAGSKVVDGQTTTVYIDGIRVVHYNAQSVGASGGSVFLREGWHDIKIESNLLPSQYEEAIEHSETPPTGWFPTEGNMDLTIKIRRASVLDPQEEHELEWSAEPQMLYLNSISVENTEPYSVMFDVQLYDGPDVPVLISPESGSETELFSPELTVYQRNCDHVEYQIDADTTFGTDLLSQWSEVCEPEEFVTSTSPSSDRPAGLYYWRARGVKNGYVSEWSDYWIVEILPLVTNDEFLYLSVNVGVADHDETSDPRSLTMNANVGYNPNPIEDARMVYQHSNIDVAIGRIIYPLYDRTEVRKEDFEGDDDFTDEPMEPEI